MHIYCLPVPLLVKTLLPLLASCRRDGVEAVPPGGPLILVADHSSRWDPVVLAAALPRPVAFLSRGPGAGCGPFSRAVVPLAQGHPDRARVLERAVDMLRKDMALGIPLGGRGVAGAVGPPGAATAALIGLRSQAPLLPVAVTGAEEIGLFRWRKPGLLRRPRVGVHIGQPFSLPLLEGPISHATLRALANMITGRVAALLAESQRPAMSGARRR